MKIKRISTNTIIKGFSLKQALCIADSENSDLLQDGNKIIICKLENYQKLKKQNCILNYTRQINKLKWQEFYMRRNSTNFRLDHNLTSLPKQFLNKIIEWNDKIEDDACSSQINSFAFALNNPHSSIIKDIIKSFTLINKNNSIDEACLYVTQCLEAVLPQERQLLNSILDNEKFYEFVAEKTGLSSRAEGKGVTFNILFSKYRNNTPAKAKLKETFPTIIECMNKIKKYGKESFVCAKDKESFFPNLLTGIESHVFIDVLFPAILKAGYHCIPKHDSRIFDRKDYHSIIKIRDEELNKINYKCKFKDNYNQPCLYVAQCLPDDKNQYHHHQKK